MKERHKTQFPRPLLRRFGQILNGQKVSRISLSFIRNSRNRASFGAVNSNAICNRIWTISYKRVAEVKNLSVQNWVSKREYRVLSHDFMAAILVSQNNETEAMLVSQTGPALFLYANVFFCCNKFA